MMTVAMMVPPCGGCGGCCGETGSEGQRVAEHAAPRPTAGERADVLDGVDVDVFAVVALAEGSARGAFQHEVERLTVNRGPFGNDVGDQAAVVAWREVHRPAGRLSDVDAVAPDVAGESYVEEVLKRLPANRRAERERQVPHRGRRVPPAPDRLRAYLLELADQLRVGEVGALADLQLVQAVYPMMRIDLLVQRQAPAQLVRELPHRGLRVSRSEHVQGDLADVPCAAVRRQRPLIWRESGGQLREALELLLGEAAGFGAIDAIRFHLFLPLQGRRRPGGRSDGRDGGASGCRPDRC